MNSATPCRFLPWDSEFFGFRIGHVIGNRLSASTVRRVEEWCAEQHIDCLYFLSDAQDLETHQVAGETGFRFVDVRLTFDRLLGAEVNDIHDNNSLLVRPAVASDLPMLRDIAASSHMYTRFYFDGHFALDKCGELYGTWITKSCEGDADVVWVAVVNDEVVGYLSCHLKNEDVGQIGLVAVRPDCRGRGLGRALMNKALCWFRSQHVTVVRVVTQGRSAEAQSYYERAGFALQLVQIWYHRWFDKIGV